MLNSLDDSDVIVIKLVRRLAEGGEKAAEGADGKSRQHICTHARARDDLRYENFT